MGKSSNRIRNKKRLGAYLAAGAGSLGMVSGAEAAVVSIDLNAAGISGLNGGTTYSKTVSLYSGSPDSLVIFNIGSTHRGMRINANAGQGIAFAGGNMSPKNFSNSQTIDYSSSFTSDATKTFFHFSGFGTSPDFGPNSYLGFRTSLNRFGYIEVTWNASTKNFYLISAAYESDIGVAIQTPNGGGGAVPEPASGAIAALLMGGTALRQWRKKRRQESNEAVAS